MEIECASPQPQTTRCAPWTSDDPFRLCQNLLDVMSLSIFQCDRLQYVRRYRLGKPFQRSTQNRPCRQNDGPFNEILQFPDVSRPRVSSEGLHNFAGNCFDMLLHALGISSHKMLDQQRDVLNSIAQRRHRHRKDVEAVIEVTAEPLF